MKNINELIEVNLKLLSEADRNCLFADNFEDAEGNELNGTFRPDFFAIEMEKRGLISINASICLITELGLEIVKNGGWYKYLETEKQKAKLLAEKEQLEFEKSKVDLELAKKMLKEYPYTKFIAWAGLVIALISGFLQLL